MIRYLFDTNACIALLNGTSSPLAARVRRHRPSEIALPAMVVYELYFGAGQVSPAYTASIKSLQRDRNIDLLDRLLLEIVPFDASDARMAGSVRAGLEAVGCPIGPIDTLIAGQALARNLTLVTANTREFYRVEGLRCEDWSVPAW